MRKRKPKKQKQQTKKDKRKILAILIGKPGSGKSTYAKNNLYNYEYVSQDEQGKIGHYINFLNLLINNTPKIVIDRMNFSVDQRMRYFVPARNLKYKISYYILDSPNSLCLKRMRERKAHPTVKRKNHKLHEKLVKFFDDNFEHPFIGEYDEINEVKTGE